MSWPLSQDYNEAIQSPAGNFADPDLKRGEAVCNALGLPAPYSGNFADVYQVRCPDGSRWAVKCFTREAAGLRERYQEISAHLKQAKLPFTVDFSYLEKGVRVMGRWYPVLKMQWVEGLTLNQFVGQNLEKPAMLEALLQLWARMGKYLRAAEIGHCDLQHGNVLLVPGATPKSLALKLIDYDGMWVPALAGKNSGEVGHPCYQHPQRLREGRYSLDVDRFPLLLVATAMRALKADKGLWAKYDNGDNLLFKESDLAAPGLSEVFDDLSCLPDPGLVMLAAQVRAALKGTLESAPLLDDALPDAQGAAPPARAPKSAEAPSSTSIPRAAPVTAVAVAAAPPSKQKAFDFDDGAPSLAATAFSAKIKRKAAKSKSGGAPMNVWVGRAAAAYRRQKWPILAGAAACLLLLGLAGLWAAGVFKLKTQDGTIVVDNVPADAEVFVDGQKVALQLKGDDRPIEIRVAPGKRTLEIKAAGVTMETREVTLASGERKPIGIRLEPLAASSVKPAAAPHEITNSIGMNLKGPKPEPSPDDPKTPPSSDKQKDPDLQAWGHLNIEQATVMDGFLRVNRAWSDKIATRESYSGPIEITVVARTSKDNIRLFAPGGASVIFNWENIPSELRVTRPDGTDDRQESGSLATANVTPLTPNTWYTLQWRITNQGMVISVDGRTVFAESRPYDLSAKCPVRVGTNGSEVDVKSFIVKAISSSKADSPPEKPKDLTETQSNPPAADGPGPISADLHQEITNTVGVKLKLIKPGKFLMGSPKDEEGRFDNEGPQHEVEITKAFYMGACPVTQAQWQAVMGGNPSNFKGDNLPVECVSWDEAVAFCEALNKQDAKRPAGWAYGLPTEAQWEYACRAGTTTAYSFGDDPKALDNYAWYQGNSGGHTHAVGGKKPNPWGLYDMHGNVWQWCADGFGPYRYSSIKDPNYTYITDNRILRGGSYDFEPRWCRSGRRSALVPTARGGNDGFRVVLRLAARTP